MIAVIQGMLASVKLKQPEAGQEFKPHQSLSIMQIVDGEAETVKIKDMDLGREHKSNIQVKIKCKLNHWSNGGRSGLSCQVVEAL